MGSEFVAAHVWRATHGDHLASRVPLLNSFVPNLVWLPGQVAKLTDREGGVVQQTLQAMAHSIYRKASVLPHLRDIAEEAWALLPPPTVKLQPFDSTDLNWFEPTDRFYRTRAARMSSVIEALEALDQGMPVRGKVVTTRYGDGLPLVPHAVRSELKDFLCRFVIN